MLSAWGGATASVALSRLRADSLCSMGSESLLGPVFDSELPLRLFRPESLPTLAGNKYSGARILTSFGTTGVRVFMAEIVSDF